MKANIALLCSNVVSPALEVRRATNVVQIHRANGLVSATTCVTPRPVLTMTWHVHPTSGRLESHWRADRGTATDEDVSCSRLARRVA